MTAANELAEVGALIGDPGRANMLLTLFDGRPHSAKELAASAGITPQTASWHLAHLTAGHLLVAEKRGRQRYYSFASPLVAQMLETALSVAQSRRQPHCKVDEALRTARTCYDHLAGKLGVAVADALVRRRCVVRSGDGGVLTASGSDFLAGFGIDLQAAAGRKRIFCRPCLDWTERRPHIAGSVGAAITTRCFELGWIERARHGRTVSITPAGRRGFADSLGLTL